MGFQQHLNKTHSMVIFVIFMQLVIRHDEIEFKGFYKLLLGLDIFFLPDSNIPKK